ncbi:heavy-metal-associated domain-containing protein [Edaphobacter modestus]|uniref:Copper chaperone CopZ n=1 Tax=Edaphobacter modestus TaxID=388466 RepID=A0A4Q7YR55_9BACT|nr:heavy-metal-associated domain-containing protein [Edaphobacter modestus]RZU39285.1 copper chaperone CopZ [Edaphobacter modestus]
MQDTLKLSIEGMHCGACVRRVTTALQAVPGVQVGAVEVGSAKLTFNPEEATAQEIVAAVDGIGFPARIEQ